MKELSHDFVFTVFFSYVFKCTECFPLCFQKFPNVNLSHVKMALRALISKKISCAFVPQTTLEKYVTVSWF